MLLFSSHLAMLAILQNLKFVLLTAHMYVEAYFNYFLIMDTFTSIHVFITNTEINYLKNWFAISITTIVRIIYYPSTIKTPTFTHIESRYVFSSCLIYVICVCLHIVVSNTYCVVFLLCVSSSWVPYVVSVSWMSILVFSNVYLVIKNIIRSIIIIVIVLYQLWKVDKKKNKKKYWFILKFYKGAKCRQRLCNK